MPRPTESLADETGRAAHVHVGITHRQAALLSAGASDIPTHLESVHNPAGLGETPNRYRRATSSRYRSGDEMK